MDQGENNSDVDEIGCEPNLNPSTVAIERNIAKPFLEKSILRRFNPPNLERKQSSGDLQSRLKTRKMLGVGETQNGDIHRSKISQVLGHNEHLFVKMPKGYWTWYTVLVYLLIFQSLLIFTSPEKGSGLGIFPSSNDSSNCGKYYAVSLFGIAYIMKNFSHLNDKKVQKVIQSSLVLIFGSQACIDLLEIFSEELSLTSFLVMIFINIGRIGICCGCIMFWRKIGTNAS